LFAPVASKSIATLNFIFTISNPKNVFGVLSTQRKRVIVMLKLAKYIILISLFLFIVFAAYGLGRVSKRDQLFERCMRYHSGLTLQDAKETCQDIQAGDRWVVRERHD
jgi:hypothetical protein